MPVSDGPANEKKPCEWVEEDGVAIATLSTEQLSAIIAEWMARQAGIDCPVQHHMQWAWSPGQGPVLLRGAVRPVPNVRRLKP